jgi:hypothetical protein
MIYDLGKQGIASREPAGTGGTDGRLGDWFSADYAGFFQMCTLNSVSVIAEQWLDGLGEITASCWSRVREGSIVLSLDAISVVCLTSPFATSLANTGWFISIIKGIVLQNGSLAPHHR